MIRTIRCPVAHRPNANSADGLPRRVRLSPIITGSVGRQGLEPKRVPHEIQTADVADSFFMLPTAMRNLKLSCDRGQPAQHRSRSNDTSGPSISYPPSRIIVGEVRQEECLDLLIALNSGLPGMCSLHANSAREAVTKLCTLPLLAGENVGHAFVLPTVAACVDIVVHARTDADGHRRVREIVAVPGRVEQNVVEIEPIFQEVNGTLTWVGGFPPHPERFAERGIDVVGVLDPTGRRR